MRSTGVLLLVLVAISYTAVNAYRWRFPFRRRCIDTTVNAVCRVSADPGTVNPVSGIITLSQTRLCGTSYQDLRVNIQLQGFSTNDSVVMHGVRVTEFGDLSNGCASLGMVYNPYVWNYNGRPLGEFCNVQEGADGSVNTTITNRVARLSGVTSLIGRGILITAGTGNSSTPVGCCVIGLAASPPPSVRPWW